jgi:hypothetical protein
MHASSNQKEILLGCKIARKRGGTLMKGKSEENMKGPEGAKNVSGELPGWCKAKCPVCTANCRLLPNHPPPHVCAKYNKPHKW